MDPGSRTQEPEIPGKFLEILSAADEPADFGLECLDSNLELQCARGKLFDDFPQGVGQTVRDHFEVDEQIRPEPFAEEMQNRAADFEIQVERAIHKLELFDASVQQFLEAFEERGEGDLPHRDVQRRQAELAREWATARRLNVDDAMRDVLVRIKIVRQRDFFQVRQFGMNDFLWWRVARQQPAANISERQISLASDHVVRAPHNLLLIDFKTHLGSAEDDRDVGSDALQSRNDLRSLRNIPDVNSEADDLRLLGDQHFNQIQRSLIDVEFDQTGAGLQFSEIRQQISEAKRGVRVSGVQRRQHNVRHGANLSRYRRCGQNEIIRGSRLLHEREKVNKKLIISVCSWLDQVEVTHMRYRAPSFAELQKQPLE